MKAIAILAAVAVTASSLGLVCLLTGCETKSAAQQVVITPSSIKLKPSQSQVFTASGGYEYNWTLADETLGTLEPRIGPSVTYTARASISNAVQTISVTSFITGSSQATTNAPAYSVSAEAYVIHIPSDE